MRLRAQEIVLLGHEIWRCLTVVVLFLIGGAAVLIWTAAVMGLELIFWEMVL